MRFRCGHSRPAAGTTRALWPPTPTHALELPRHSVKRGVVQDHHAGLALSLRLLSKKGVQVAQNLLAAARTFDHRVLKPLALSFQTERTAMRLIRPSDPQRLLTRCW